MPIATTLSFMGIAKQAVAGTPVAPTDFIALTADPKPVDVITPLHDKAWRGSAVTDYNIVQGQRKSSLSLDGNLDMTTIGYPLQGVLPDLVVTGAAAPYSSVFATKNTGTTQAVPYTFSDYTGFETRQYSDAKYEELTLTFTADGLVTFKSKVQCWASVVSGTKPTPSYNTAPPPAAYAAVFTIGGVGAVNVMTGEITIKRPIDVQQTVGGVQDPYGIWQGPISASGKLDFVYEGNTEFQRYLANTQVPLDIKLTQGTTSLQLHSTLTAFITGAIGRGKTFNDLSTTFECLANVTDAGASAGFSPLKATLVNAKASGTYA
jgi:hypothetical protein